MEILTGQSRRMIGTARYTIDMQDPLLLSAFFSPLYHHSMKNWAEDIAGAPSGHLESSHPRLS